MADAKQLAILLDSVRIWNLWRTENKDTSIDLSEAHLRGADLQRADLHGANLSNADLSNADLSGADLRNAHLRGAFLIDAYLSEADLSETNLRNAHLQGVYLSGVDLYGANLSNADLTGAHLMGAKLVAATLNGADLRMAELGWVNLSKAHLIGVDLHEANLHDADLHEAVLLGANLREADLRRVDMREAILIRADLFRADLTQAHLNKAHLREAFLYEANLRGADFQYADLREADLSMSVCVNTDFSQATLTSCRIYGIACWDVTLDNTVQQALCITPDDQPEITVDNLEVAQFIYLMLNNKNIRRVIDTVTSKVVLILGNFAPERKTALDTLRDELRQRDYLPIVFDFEKPSSRDLTETVSTLAHMARFVIADLTDAKSIGDELANVVPFLPSVAIQPLIQENDTEYALFGHWQRFPWVLETYRYQNLETLLANLKEGVIDPAEQRANEVAPQQKTAPPA